MSERITRNTVVTMLGTPDRTEGSLNSPVEREEHGISYNEKWTYEHLTSDPAGVPMRAVYWHRYDFTGTMVRGNSDQEWRKDETLGEALRQANSRLAPIRDRHQPYQPTNRYRPVSQPRDRSDLGGYVQNWEEK